MVFTISRRMALTLGATAIATLLALPALAQGKSDFVIGVALPTTGSAAPFGLDDVQALEWGIADINAAGGANGRMLTMRVVDTQANPQIGIEAATRLIGVNGVQLISVSFSTVVAAIAPIVNRNKVLTLSTGAQSPRIAELGDYVFTTYPLAGADVQALAKYSVEKLGADKSAVLYLNDESGIYSARVYREALEAEGGEIVAFESYEPGATDYTGIILKIRASNPEVIHLHGNAGDTPQVVRQLRQLGLTQPITSYVAAYNPELLKQVGKQADGLIVATVAPGVTDSEAVADFAERFRKELGRESGNLPVNQYFYDVAYIVKALVEVVDAKGEALTGENLRTALLEIGTFDLPLSGLVTFSASGALRKTVYLLEVKNAEFVPIGKFE